MVGERLRMWINELKIAIIEKNPEKIDSLVECMPMLDDVKDMEAAAYLLKEANLLMMTLKDETAESLKKIKKTKEFLSSTHLKESSLFNSKV